MAVETGTRMSATEFFQLEETNQPTELLHGALIVSPSPITDHQIASSDTNDLLRDIIPNGRVFYAPLDVYLDENNVVQPDLMWVAANSQCRITRPHLQGPPDLIVEIFSPGTVRRDKIDKFKLYEQFGVREYWMIDPTERYLEVYTLHEGQYRLLGIFGPEQQFESPVLGTTVDMRRIFPAE